MARITLQIAEPALRMMIKTLLEAAGNHVAERDADLLVTDSVEEAVRAAGALPAVLLCSAGQRAAAVEALRAGVSAYVVLPLEPGELELMVQRAAGPAASAPEAPPLKPLAQVEQEHILRVLRHCKHNQAEAARILRIGRNTLWRKLRGMREFAREDS